MAKDILYIANGEEIDPTWTNHIVISSDGVNWDGISKVGISAGKHSINLNTSAPNSYPERNKENGFVIVLKRGDSEGPLLKFNPEKVVNQATWLSQGSPIANANKALADILTWLA
jgi:hypothetical protein